MIRIVSLWFIIWTWMVSLQPQAPWFDTYAETAIAIADTIESEPPLYRDDEARIHTAATLVALARFESAFDAHATGDNGASHGLYQQQRFGPLADVREATRVALSQIRISSRICRGKAPSEMLGWYAAGGDGCDNARGLAQSRNRMKLAFRLAGREGTL